MLSAVVCPPTTPTEMFASCNSWLFATLCNEEIQSSLGSKAGKDEMEMLGLIGAESWANRNVRVGRVGDWIAGRQTKELVAKNGRG